MKHGLVLVAFLFGTFSVAEDQYLLFPEWKAELTRFVQPQQLAYAEGDVFVLKVPHSQVETWAHRVHESLGGCGGFIDVTSEVKEGITPLRLVWNELDQKNRFRDPIHPIVVIPDEAIQTLVDQVDEQKYWAFLERLAKFPDRSATTRNGSRAAQFIKEHANSVGQGVSEFRTWEVETNSFFYRGQPSVVATYPGTDPNAKQVVIGAHMDTFSFGKPGADDDASGSAVVMEALRVIAQSGARFVRPINFVWYAAEERGLVGSKYVVQHFQNNRIGVHAAIQFDMVGWNSPEDDKDIYVINDYTDAILNNALRQLIRTYTDASIGETRCDYACSDHASWHRAGIPVVFPFEASFENMNQKLHTGEDRLRFIDKAHAVRFARLAVAFLGELAEYQP